MGFQIGLNAMLSPLTAVLPDRVAPERRGLASGLIGFGTLLAQSLGAVVGAAFLTDVRAGLALVPWIMAITAIIFALSARDVSNLDTPKIRVSWREVLRTFRVPADRDFLLALFGRLLLLLALYCVMLFQFFILQDHIGLDQAGIAGTIGTGGVLLAVGAGVGTLVAGPLSDRIGRRKPLATSPASSVTSATAKGSTSGTADTTYARPQLPTPSDTACPTRLSCMARPSRP